MAAPSNTVNWQTVREAEEKLIEAFRAERSRQYDTTPLPEKRVGLAFSGGGIRSATFNLGVLQALRDNGVLPLIDYISTVSGGGYIGSWLATNTLRRPGFLTPNADWSDSIRHLRRYSNYLSPRLGFFSADTWTMAAIWLRNTHLLQSLVMAVVALLFALVPWIALGIDCLIGSPLIHLLAPLLLAIPAGIVIWGLVAKSGPRQAIVQIAVMSLLCFGALFAAILFRDSAQISQNGFAQHQAMRYVVLAMGIGLAVPGVLSRCRWHALAILSAAAATAAFVELSRQLALLTARHSGARELAFVAGGPAVLMCLAASITLLIGLEGREMRDARREWWSRLAAWLAIYSLGWLAVTGCALLAPAVMRGTWQWIYSGGAVWIGATIASVLAAKSSRTGERKPFAWNILEVVTQVGPYVFVAGLATIVATIVERWAQSFSAVLILTAITLLLAWRIDLNEFSLNHFYRNRLVRCYLGATRDPAKRQPDRFTGLDFDDDIKLHEFADPVKRYAGPMPIVNAAVNLGGSADLDVKNRRAASFFFTPAYSGSRRMNRPEDGEIEFTPTRLYPDKDGVSYGTAVSISGAAASPNMGFHTSSVVAFLLTVFNVRLGWWMPNRKRQNWYSGRGGSPKFGLSYLIKELFGNANERSAFVNLSDGAHFENLGVYELLRRECEVIIASDVDCDRKFQFPSLGGLIRIAEVDFGTRIVIDVQPISKGEAHTAIGEIYYASGRAGKLIYIKASLTSDEPADVRQYQSENNDFPHETTGDQFFEEAQFESYRKLGLHIGAGVTPEAIAAA